jgi:hypothetical protein
MPSLSLLPNNSKQVPQKYLLQKKLEAVILQRVAKIGRKRPENIQIGENK